MNESAQSVPKAYKQTEVGVIPEDWETTTLSNCVRTDAPICYGILMPGQHFDGGTPVVKVKDIYNGRIDETCLLLTHPAIDDAYSRSRLQSNDIPVTIRGTTGRIAVVPNSLNGANITQDTARVRIKPKLSSMYVYSALHSQNAQEQIALHTIGQAVKGINIRDVKAITISLPPMLAEQEAIASALSDADRLIESLEKLIAKKRQIKQGTMQELLTGQRRLPGFTGKWETKRLGEVGSFLKGSGVTKSQAQSGNLPCVRYGELYTRHHDYIRDYYSFISKEVAETASRLVKGDILFAGSGETKGDIGKCAAFLENCEAYAGGDVVILRVRGGNSLFLGYHLNTTDVTQQKASLGQGDAVVHISASALATIEVTLPEFKEQTAIATILSDMDAEIAVLEAKLSKARQVKQGMMQELLTGRIRLV